MIIDILININDFRIETETGRINTFLLKEGTMNETIQEDDLVHAIKQLLVSNEVRLINVRNQPMPSLIEILENQKCYLDALNVAVSYFEKTTK